MPPAAKSKNVKKYRQGPPSRPGRNKVEGPGVWVTCIKGKEKYAVGELYDLFESVAKELYPSISSGKGADDVVEDEEEDLEKAMEKELAEMKKPRKESYFVVFIACRPPIDPVQLVLTHLSEVERTGVTHTRHALRFSPVSGSCAATIPDMVELAKRLFPATFDADPSRSFKYRIQINARNHTTLKRDEIILALAPCVPNDRGHTVSLDHPDLVILVEIYMFVCGMSVVPDYDRFKKFNVTTVADASRKLKEVADGDGTC